MTDQSDLALILTEFGNLHPSSAAAQRLQKNWPDLLPSPPQFGFTMYSTTDSGDEIPLSVPEDLHYVFWLRDLVRELWLRSSRTGFRSELEFLMLTGQVGLGMDSIVNRFIRTPVLKGIVELDLRHKRFEYRPQTLLQRALYFLLQNLDNAKFCGNPDCPAPFFIAPRSNTKFCSDACLEDSRRKAKRLWWKNRGIEWREKRNERKLTKRNRKKSST